MPGHWVTEIIAMIYIFIWNDWTDTDATLGALGYVIYNGAFFTFQFFFAPLVKEWYEIAMRAVNTDEYTIKGIEETKTPDLDDLSYLSPDLVRDWKIE